MHSLASYIRAIHALSSPVSISDAQVEEQQRSDFVQQHRRSNGVLVPPHATLPASSAAARMA